MNAVIFDFDGTIADSFEQVLAFLCSQAGRPTKDMTAEQKQKLRGLSMRELALAVGVPNWKLPLVYFRGKAKLSKHMRSVKPFDGIVDMLTELHDEHYKLYIISSNNKRNIATFLVHNGMSGYFSAVYGNAGWFGKGGMLKRAMARHRLEPAKTVYVGDESRDLIAAKVAGMPSAVVSWGFGSEEQLLKFSPTILVRKPGELKKALVDWGKTV